MNRKPFKHSTTFYRQTKKLKSNWKMEQPISTALINDVQNQPINTEVPVPILIGEPSIDIADTIYVDNDVDDINNLPMESCESEDILQDDEDDEQNFMLTNMQKKELLRNWIITNKISHKATNELLNILTNFFDVQNLPKDARTFLRTPTEKDKKIIKMGCGEYWHNGLSNSLKGALHDISSPDILILSFNVDGLPLYKSSKEEFWPILAKVENMPKLKPVVIGIYSGVGKPPCNEFLSEFVEELNECIKNGIKINDFQIKVVIKCFICDTPARAFVRGTVGFNAYHGCLKCNVVGEYDDVGRHMSYPRIDILPRTDESFRGRDDPDHHKMDSILEKLPIDMIKDFVVADSLHLLDLGIMKKLLVGWSRGGFNFRTKFSARDIENISFLLKECNKWMPIEIHRAVRGLDVLAFWKGLEFRTFLLYVGPVVLKDFLPEDNYNHYLHLFCAIRICSSEYFFSKQEYVQVADGLIKDFIEQYIDLYGVDSIGSNVHNLSHLMNDVQRFGILPKISAYPFENMLYFVKNLLRSGKNPLSQAANRILEYMDCEDFSSLTKKSKAQQKFPYLSKLIKDSDGKYANVNFENFILEANEKNQWFLTKSNEVVQIEYATIIENNIQIYGSKIKYLSPFFNTPFNSTFIKIYSSDGSLHLLKTFHGIEDIECKLIALNFKTIKMFIPLLHSFE